MDVPGGQLCARARFWASLRIDGELSELEGALLDAHLARCEACRSVAGDFGALTATIRAAQPARSAAVAVHRPRSPLRLVGSIAAAAVLLAGMVAGGLVRGQVSHPSGTAPRVVAIVAGYETPDQLRRLRRTSLLNMRKLPRDISGEPV